MKRINDRTPLRTVLCWMQQDDAELEALILDYLRERVERGRAVYSNSLGDAEELIDGELG
jgi:hypothetical protein